MEKEILSNIPSIVYRCLLDSNLTRLYISDYVKELFGYEASEMIQNKEISFAKLINPEDKKKMFLQLMESVKNKTNYNLEYRMQCCHSKECWVLDKGKPIFDEAGHFLYLDGVITNISTYKLVERALSESEQKYISFLKNSGVGIVRTKLSDGTIIEINDTFIKMLGYENLDDLISNYSMARLYAEEKGREKFLSAFQNDTLTNYEVPFLRVNKSILWTSCSSQIHRAEGYIDVVYIDITSQKIMGQEAEKAKAQMLEASKYSALGTLAGGIAHELSTPANVVLGYSNMISDALERSQNINKENIQNMIQKQVQAIKKMESILDSVRTFGKIDNSNDKLNSFHSAINNTIKLVEPIYQKESVKILTELNASSDKVIANVHLLQQIVLNIIENAKFAIAKTKTENERLIKIRTYNEDKLYIMEISDTGSGIPKDILDRIFEPFFTTKAPGEGTGLGLSVVRSTIKSINGNIAVESEENKGTKFRISIPFTD